MSIASLAGRMHASVEFRPDARAVADHASCDGEPPHVHCVESSVSRSTADASKHAMMPLRIKRQVGATALLVKRYRDLSVSAIKAVTLVVAVIVV